MLLICRKWAVEIEFGYEFVEAIKMYASDDKNLCIFMMKELSDNVTNGNFKTSLNEEIDSICRKNELCPSCFGEIEISSHMESRGEYFGFPSEETIYSRKCTRCGRIIE